MDNRQSKCLDKLSNRTIISQGGSQPPQQLEFDFDQEEELQIIYRHPRPDCWSERCSKEDRENCI